MDMILNTRVCVTRSRIRFPAPASSSSSWRWPTHGSSGPETSWTSSRPFMHLLIFERQWIWGIKSVIYTVKNFDLEKCCHCGNVLDPQVYDPSLDAHWSVDFGSSQSQTNYSILMRINSNYLSSLTKKNHCSQIYSVIITDLVLLAYSIT